MERFTKLTFCAIALSTALAVSASAQAKRPGSPSIGAADGVSYEVIGERTVTVMDAGRCGYHDLSWANGATFRVETRLYHEYRDGRLVRTWQTEARTFLRCHEL